jgi:hypothetical protein
MPKAQLFVNITKIVYRSSKNRLRDNSMDGPKGSRHPLSIEPSPIFVSVEEFPKYGVIVVKKIVWKSGRLQRYLSITEAV